MAPRRICTVYRTAMNRLISRTAVMEKVLTGRLLGRDHILKTTPEPIKMLRAGSDVWFNPYRTGF
jgi:hypothetical protein